MLVPRSIWTERKKMKEIIGFLLMIAGGIVMGFGLGRIYPQLDLTIAVIIAVVGIILMIVGEILFLRNKKR